MTFEFAFVLVGLMQVVGFFIQGCTGFGCTVIAASVTTGLLGIKEGVPYGTLMTLPFMYYLGIKAMNEVSWKDLGKILALCAPGILVGNYLFATVSPNVAKIAIGIMICLIALMNINKYIIQPLILKKELKEESDTLGKKLFSYGCLILGGIVHGAFNIGGPLITVYTVSAVKEKEKFRTTMTWVWAILNTVNAFNQYRSGAITPHLLSALAVGLPMAGIGFFLGMRFLEKINREQFLRIVYVVLLFIGADMLIRSILAL